MNINEMSKEEKVEAALELGYKQAKNMSEKTLDEKLCRALEVEQAERFTKENPEPDAPEETEGPQYGEDAPEGPVVNISDGGQAFLNEIGFNMDWLAKLGVQFNLDQFDYIDKFKAFRCYREGTQLDWIDVNDLSLLNGGRKLCQIFLKHQPVTRRDDYPDRGCIDLPWRA